VLSVGGNNSRFVTLACINIVVGANAGGAFSPFGDITTLMVWQKGFVEFWTFFALFLPAALNFLVPAIIMSFAIPGEHPVGGGEKIMLMMTLTAGVGGSLLSIGSAAGVALMGQARGKYTFFGHLKVESGHCARLCCEYLRSPVDKCGLFLKYTY
jgi:Na+/H+ antiporter NhaD/arsenite permease-like protein